MTTTVRSGELQAENVAHLLDDLFRLGHSRYRFGLDPLIGLLPVIGDAAATAGGAPILLAARRLGVPFPLLLRMAYNLLVNGLVGAIPLFGDFYSFQYKCHAKNAALLVRAIRHRDDGTCDILAPPVRLADWVVVLTLTLPIVLLVGYVSFWFWNRELHFL